MKDGISMARTSFLELSRAAYGLLHSCVAPNQIGGIAMDIGKAMFLGLDGMMLILTMIWRKGLPEIWVLS